MEMLEENNGILEIRGTPLSEIREKFLISRAKRIRPATDTKILTSWNGLMISGYVRAYTALGVPEYLRRAEKAAAFYAGKIREQNGKVFRTYMDPEQKIPGFLDDFAFLGMAFLDLFQATFHREWLELAGMIITVARQKFMDGSSPFFHYVSRDEKPLISATMDLTDNVIPSSNSAMGRLMLIFGIISGIPEPISLAGKMVQAMRRAMEQNMAFHTNWGNLLMDTVYPPFELKIAGENIPEIRKKTAGEYLPGMLFCGEGEPGHPSRTLIYVCRKNVCFEPFLTAGEAIEFMNREK
jgi:uncharacterized protein YyaL (SSP411 family)